MRHIPIIPLLVLSVLACNFACNPVPSQPQIPPPPFDSLFMAGESLGTITDDELVEISGLVMSHQHEGILWVHNDSGDDPRIYAIDTTGQRIATYTLPTLIHRDWEDISKDQAGNLYIGEIGDNDAQYDEIFVHQFAEPTTLVDGLILEVNTYTLQYPDGARDAEALMIDPWTDEVHIVTKREDFVALYTFGPLTDTNQTYVGRKADFTFPFRLVTAGDIHPSGDEILLKNYDTIYYWERALNVPLSDALNTEPKRLPYISEPQGEAITWDRAGKNFFTTSELRNRITPQLYYYRRE